MNMEETGSGLVCTICLRVFCEPRVLSCGHSFCAICLQHSLQQSKHCPLCKQSCDGHSARNFNLEEIIEQLQLQQSMMRPAKCPRTESTSAGFSSSSSASACNAPKNSVPLSPQSVGKRRGRVSTRGAWIFGTFNNPDICELVFAPASNVKYEFPMGSKAVRDGVGGVWILTNLPEEEGSWWLWHADLKGTEPKFKYPSDSKLAGDGRGGVWILCTTKGNSLWQLWHVNKRRETSHFHKNRQSVFPSHSKLAGDGHGGVWVLFKDKGTGHWHSSHVTLQADTKKYAYRAEAKLIGDGMGGVWVLHKFGAVMHLWHANNRRQRFVAHVPENSRFVSALDGGVLVLCNMGAHANLWYARKDSCEPDYVPSKWRELPAAVEIATADDGSPWVLRPTFGEPDRALCRLSPSNTLTEVDKHIYPSTARFVRETVDDSDAD